MERTVPSTASEEVELYLRTYYSILRSTAEVQIRTLEEAHAGMNSLMHPEARKQTPDTSAFIYSLLRLPDCLPQVKTVVLGQSQSVGDVDRQERVFVPLLVPLPQPEAAKEDSPAGGDRWRRYADRLR